MMEKSYQIRWKNSRRNIKNKNKKEIKTADFLPFLFLFGKFFVFTTTDNENDEKNQNEDKNGDASDDENSIHSFRLNYITTKR